MSRVRLQVSTFDKDGEETNVAEECGNTLIGAVLDIAPLENEEGDDVKSQVVLFGTPEHLRAALRVLMIAFVTSTLKSAVEAKNGALAFSDALAVSRELAEVSGSAFVLSLRGMDLTDEEIKDTLLNITAADDPNVPEQGPEKGDAPPRPFGLV